MSTETTAESNGPEFSPEQLAYLTIHSTWADLGDQLNAAAAQGYYLAHDIIDRGGNSITLVLRNAVRPPGLQFVELLAKRALDLIPTVLADLAAGKRIDELDLLKRVLGINEDVGLAVVKNINDAHCTHEPPPDEAPAEGKIVSEYEHPTP